MGPRDLIMHWTKTILTPLIDIHPRNIPTKFQENPFTNTEVMAKVKVLHDDDADAAATDDRDMAIPRLFFFEKTAELKRVLLTNNLMYHTN